MHVDSFNHSRTGFRIRHVMFLAIAAAALVGLLICISYQAFAGQLEDAASSSEEAERIVDSTLDQLEVVEEIDLGDQGVFLDGHVLATIHADGQVYTVDTDGKSEEELTALYGFTLENEDYTEQSENEYGYDLYVNRMTVETVTEEVEIPYETTRVADKTMKKGVEKVTTAGQNGVQLDTYEVRTLNGETTTTLIDSEVVTEAVDEVVTYGTSTAVDTGYTNNGSSLNLTSDTITSVDTENKTFTTSSGQVYSYSRSLTCTGYAYYEPGGLTKTGTACRQGAIAVDPSVIPLGSRLFIIASDGSVVYGVATAEDTGGNIKGNTVDLYYNSESLCRSFGRRNVTIYILD